MADDARYDDARYTTLPLDLDAFLAEYQSGLTWHRRLRRWFWASCRHIETAEAREHYMLEAMLQTFGRLPARGSDG